MSKGSNRRPQQISDKEMAENWNRIFNSQPKGAREVKKNGSEEKKAES